MLREKIKNLIYFIINFTSFFGRIFFNIPRVVILMYHSVSDNAVLFSVKPTDFERQMDYLRTNKYKVISLGQLVVKLRSRQKLENKTVVLTFDDGYLDNYTNAWPILRKYNFHATIFMPTVFIGQDMNNSQNLPLAVMGREQIKEMSDSGLIEFGSHTHSHPRLENISEEEFKREARQSKEIIESIIGNKCELFSYPKGFLKKEFSDILAGLGYRAAVSVKEGMIGAGDDLFSLKRNFIYSGGGFSQFKGKLGNSVIIYNLLKKIIRS